MPYELFWKGSLGAFDQYARKSHIEELRADERAWLQGLYIADAVAQNLSTKHIRIYPKEPYLVSRAREEKQSDEDKNIRLYHNLRNWSAGVSARINNAPSDR